ncbi:MAG: hypothetical protein Q9181_008107 [Wetmoreana brouardii]
MPNNSATGVSIYRATQIAHVDESDFSYDSTNRSIWSGVEICSAIICANLATIRPILKYLRTGKAALTHPTFTATSGASRGAMSGTSRSKRQRWTWRHIGASTGQPGSESSFHRLEQHPEGQSTYDMEKQELPRYTISPVKSPEKPDAAHFDDSY